MNLLMRRTKSLYLNVLLFFVVIVLVIAINNSLKQTSVTNEWVFHTERVRQSLSELLSYVNDTQAGARGYLITKQVEYLEPYFKAKDLIPAKINQIEQLTIDNPSQLKRIKQINEKILAELTIINQLIDLKQKNDVTQQDNLLKTGKLQMDSIRSLLKEMNNIELALLNERLLVFDNANHNLMLIVNITCIFIIVLIITINLIANNSIQAIKTREEKLKLQTQTLDLAHKELEEKLNSINLLNAELAKANEEILEASKLKSQFVANMSHEIRTPMNGIIGMCNALLTTQLDNKQLDYAFLIKEASNSLLVIINDILDFSKIEANKLELEFIEFNIDNVIETTCDILASQVQKKKLSLMSFIDPNISTKFIGDPERLKQILINLGGNAIKFTQSGEVIISAKLHSQENNITNILFSVEDNGIGLKEVDFNSIIKPFMQADGSISRRFGGTGLGLSICKKLIDLMHGNFGIDQDRQVGSKFWFTIPLQNITNIEPSKIPASLNNVRVLIVDDEPGARDILHSYILSFGMRNGTAANAQEAIEKLEQGCNENNEVQIAIIDLLMPETNGLELAKLILNNPKICNTRLILITAHDAPGFSKQAIETGFKAYLTKPIKKSQLLNCLFEVINNGESILSTSAIDSITANRENLNLAPDNLVLIVEDHQINQQVTQIYLNELGLPSHIVNNGQEALETYAKNNYSFILMDCQMPKMDGYTATQHIRSLEKKNGIHTPIIAMTAHAMTGDREKCLASGMDDYLSKPINPKEFKQTILKWLKFNPENNLSIDFKTLNIKYNPSDLNKLLEMFKSDGMNFLNNLKEALKQKDSLKIQDLAHGFKGVCLTLELKKLYGLNRQLENLASGSKEFEQATFEQLIKSIEIEYNLVIEELTNKV